MRWAEYGESRRSSMTRNLEARFKSVESWCAPISEDASWTVNQIRDFVLGGKMLRGILACLSYDMFAIDKFATDMSAPDTLEQEGSARPIRLGSALELIQAGLLVHDDIMDNDELRRGKPTLHRCFAARTGSESVGQGEAICAGDLCYFLSMQDIALVCPEIGPLMARELSMVCLAQMEDSKSGEAHDLPSLDRVLSLYRYKTGRYTMVLPLQAGALAAGRPDVLPHLETIGENLGILFQIQDDRLGLFGDERELGKPVGSDIREGKKTPYALFLMEALPPSEKSVFESILGKGTVSASEIEYVRWLVTKYGVDERVSALARQYQDKANLGLERLSSEVQDIDREKLEILREFIESSSLRTK